MTFTGQCAELYSSAKKKKKTSERDPAAEGVKRDVRAWDTCKSRGVEHMIICSSRQTLG